jgi:predicted enzyme related to lactoylglutathione lyase
MANPVVYFEIGCRDRGATTKFYSDLFGWQIADAGGASTIPEAPGGIAGHITALGHEPHNYTLVYVAVDDVAAYLAKVEALGGKTLVPPVPIPAGIFAWFADPEGNRVGIIQRKTE